ncbi:MAG: type VII toxin-antitoxin system HepT family RNase toxin [Bacillota bacterium]
MYNKNLIAERLNIIRSAVKRLKLLAQIPAEEFCGNEDCVDIAENRLRRAIEALFDLGRHLVVKTGAGVPSDYRSIIKLLTESGIIPDEFSRQIAGMSGYRNRLIHDYNKVTPEELYQVLQTRLSDFELFCQHIVDYQKEP